MVIDHKIIIN